MAKNRVLFPNGASLSLEDGMHATEATGAAGFHHEVTFHLVRVFGNARLLSVVSAGLQRRQIPAFGRSFGRLTTTGAQHGAGAVLDGDLRPPTSGFLRNSLPSK